MKENETMRVEQFCQKYAQETPRPGDCVPCAMKECQQCVKADLGKVIRGLLHGELQEGYHTEYRASWNQCQIMIENRMNQEGF